MKCKLLLFSSFMIVILINNFADDKDRHGEIGNGNGGMEISINQNSEVDTNS